MSRDTIPDRLLAHAHVRPAAPAYFIREDGRWRPTTWRRYVEECRTAARALIALGVGPNARVSLLGFNRPEWVTLYHAAMLCGSAAAGIYTTSSPDEVAHVIAHSSSRVVLVEDRAQYEKVVARRDELPKLAWIVTMRGVPAIDDPQVLTWDELIAQAQGTTDAALDARIAALAPEQLATLIYTSGTTGPPKGVMLSHTNLAWTASALVAAGEGTAKDCTMSYLPLSHIAEQLATIHLPTTVGAPVYFAESIDKVRENVGEVRPTVFFGVPRVWEKFYTVVSARFAELTGSKARMLAWTRRVCTAVNARKMRGEPVGAMLALQYQLAYRLVLRALKARLGMDRARILVSGAAPIGLHVLEFFASIDLVILELYGLSETSGPLSYNVPGKTKLGSVGPALPGTEVRIAADGEILTRGPNVFMGYLDEPEATRAALVDGWLHTGDLGVIDADGFVTITGRKKELLITAGGKNIAPKNLEGGIKAACPLIADVVVIGDRRKYLTALVTLAEATPAPADVREQIQKAIDAVNETIARSEQIKKFTILPIPFSIEAGELTPTMKIKRSVVNEKYAREIEAMYEENALAPRHSSLGMA